LSSSQIAPINAVSPYKETEMPKLSPSAASFAYSFGCVASSARYVMNTGGGGV